LSTQVTKAVREIFFYFMSVLAKQNVYSHSVKVTETSV